MTQDPAPPLVRADGLGLRTRRGWVFRDVDLALPGGSVIALAGQAGSGRSMLLLTLAGRARPTAGTFTVGGDGHRAHIRRSVAVARITASVELEPELRVIDHIREAALLAHGAFDYRWARQLIASAADSPAWAADSPTRAAGSAAPGRHSTARVRDSAARQGDWTAPGDDSAAPGRDLPAPGGDSTARGRGSAALGGDSAAPGRELPAPGGHSAAPGPDSAVRGRDSAAPGDDSSAPEGDSSAPGGVSAAPGCDSSVPGRESAAPGGDSAVPGGDSSGHDSAASGGVSSASGGESSAQGRDSAARAVESTARWGGSVVPAVDSAALVGDLAVDVSVLLAVALALATRPLALVVDDVDLRASAAQQARIWRALRSIADEGTMVIASTVDADIAAEAGATVVRVGETVDERD